MPRIQFIFQGNTNDDNNETDDAPISELANRSPKEQTIEEKETIEENEEKKHNVVHNYSSMELKQYMKKLLKRGFNFFNSTIQT